MLRGLRFAGRSSISTRTATANIWDARPIIGRRNPPSMVSGSGEPEELSALALGAAQALRLALTRISLCVRGA
jgi:hypothetical protein